MRKALLINECPCNPNDGDVIDNLLSGRNEIHQRAADDGCGDTVAWSRLGMLASRSSK